MQATDKLTQFDSFEEFVESYPPEGLGTDIATLVRLCENKPRVLDLIERATHSERGGDRRSASFADKNGGGKSNFKVDNVKVENSSEESGEGVSEAVSQTWVSSHKWILLANSF